jgi:PIN domain nuclease of toxin-antitoxin system
MYLLDTAVWLNGLTMPEVLPSRIRTLLESEAERALCTVSLLEAAILHRLGRLVIEGDLAELFRVGLSRDLRLVDLTPAIALKTNALPEAFHGDPFDRTIVATAAAVRATLITSDPGIRDAEACAVEYFPFRPRRQSDPTRV